MPSTSYHGDADPRRLSKHSADEPVRPGRRKLFRALAAVALSLGLAGCTATRPATDARSQAPRNIIIMFADGAAATQWDFGQYSSRVLRDQPFAVTDVVFRDGVLGLISTRPHGSYVTDSAAAASAMSTGHKVRNDVVSIAPDGRNLRTLMQAAKDKGKRIGMVTTATVYDATPAAFSVNAKSRRDYPSIVDQFDKLGPDVLMGGGANYFLPQGAPGSRRKDDRDVVASFRAKGYDVVTNTGALKAAASTRVLGLFAAGDMSFELDRTPDKEPSTAEMTTAALKALSQSSPRGFVLLVENENVDTAGHANDAASLMHALWAFDDAVKVALEFQRHNPDTLLIVTGDHETGGFSATYAQKDLSTLSSKNRFYAGEAQVRMLARNTISFAAFAQKLGRKPAPQQLDTALASAFPAFRLDPDLRALVLEQKASARNFNRITENTLGMMVARQTGLYWGTSGHTPEPAVVGAIGPGASLFRGYQDNTDFGKHLHRLIEAW